jgi:2-hydroxychromene-2-carboxylate isomerase
VSSLPVSFYFDLASPLAYLAAERALHVLPGPAPWEPVLARELPGKQTFDSFRGSEEQEIFRAEIARRAAELGLQPLRWPEPFPFDSLAAMRVATFAASIGRAVAFAQAAFRQAFAGGQDLQDPDRVLVAAAACEMHPAAVLAALRRPALERQLRERTTRAAQGGVRDVPAVAVGGRVFHGERALEQAGAYAREESIAVAAAGGR